MKNITRLQVEKIYALKKCNTVDVELIALTFEDTFCGEESHYNYMQLINVFLDGKPTNLKALPLNDAWLLRHLLDNVTLCRKPKRIKSSLELSRKNTNTNDNFYLR